ncbi:MAG: alpha-amylase family glycosyl hydrolase, partial [Fulvivirga sp.]|nr:alpha-amylase family glycosyl hydrolase [Fulvivirga sp.]
MKYKTYLIILLFITFGSCTQDQRPDHKYDRPDNPHQNEIAYEIFVQSFADTDGDSIGDINGMTKKLDYLQQLGVSMVWLMPIMPSPSYHKYDVTNYKAIHPDYGTMDEFKSFVSKAHATGIRVIIDLIINHTSSQHPWFIKAIKNPESKYRDYYVWADKDSIATQIAKKEVTLDSDNLTQWHAVDGDTTSKHYYGFFWGGMPDLNFDHPAVRKEIYEIGRF